MSVPRKRVLHTHTRTRAGAVKHLISAESKLAGVVGVEGGWLERLVWLMGIETPPRKTTLAWNYLLPFSLVTTLKVGVGCGGTCSLGNKFFPLRVDPNFENTRWTASCVQTLSPQRAHDVNTTSPQRRCNHMTLHRRWFCLCWGFTAQSTQWGHVERGQFT